QLRRTVPVDSVTDFGHRGSHGCNRVLRASAPVVARRLGLWLRLQQRITSYPGSAVFCQCASQREYLFGKMVGISESRFTNATNELHRYKHSRAANVFW